MNKKKILLFSSILFVFILIFSSIVYDHQQGKNMTLMSIIGHSLFMIQSDYNDIIKNKTQQLTIEHVTDMKSKLNKIEAYSDTIDHAVGTPDLLDPIAKNLIAITDSMEKSYKENNRFTEHDQENYSTLIKESTALIPLLDKVYYVPGSIEGGEVLIKINGYEGIQELNNRLGKSISSISK